MHTFQISVSVQLFLSFACSEHLMFIIRRTVLYIQPYMLYVSCIYASGPAGWRTCSICWLTLHNFPESVGMFYLCRTCYWCAWHCGVCLSLWMANIYLFIVIFLQLLLSFDMWTRFKCSHTHTHTRATKFACIGQAGNFCMWNKMLSLGRPRRRWKMILKWILKEQGGRLWTGLIWLRIGTCGGLLWIR